MSTDRFKRGADVMEKVYAGLVPAGEQGNDRLMDLMVPSIFGELWNEDILSIPNRRLFTMGIIAAQGESSVFQIQCMAALKNGEFTEAELRELVVHAAPYAGYPRVGGLRVAVETAIADFNKKE